MRAAGVRPDLVLCSTAVRARQTFDGVRPAFAGGAEGSVEISVEGGLYGASASELLRRLRQLPPATSSALVIAHNPGMHDLVLALAGDGDHDLLAKVRVTFPTAALATIDFGDTPWSNLDRGTGYLAAAVYPKDLPAHP